MNVGELIKELKKHPKDCLVGKSDHDNSHSEVGNMKVKLISRFMKLKDFIYKHNIAISAIVSAIVGFYLSYFVMLNSEELWFRFIFSIVLGGLSANLSGVVFSMYYTRCMTRLSKG